MVISLSWKALSLSGGVTCISLTVDIKHCNSLFSNRIYCCTHPGIKPTLGTTRPSKRHTRMERKREFEQSPNGTFTSPHVCSLEALKAVTTFARASIRCPRCSSWSTLLDPALLLPATLPELMSILPRPPARKLPRVRCERGGGGALTKSAKGPALPSTADLLRRAEDTLPMVIDGG